MHMSTFGSVVVEIKKNKKVITYLKRDEDDDKPSIIFYNLQMTERILNLFSFNFPYSNKVSLEMNMTYNDANIKFCIVIYI